MNKIRSKQPAVSITVAAYNVHEWIEECLDSIVAQTFTDFECIVVDDRSRDVTPDIVEAYAKKDPRIKLVKHDKNQGLAVTRRTGLSYCRGQYVWQIDGDDYIGHDALGVLYNTATRDQVDIVRGEFLVFKNNEVTTKPSWFLSLEDFCAIQPSNCKELYMNPGSICLNFISRHFLLSLRLDLLPLYDLGEDFVTNSFLYKYAKNISITSHVIYFYRQRQASYTKVDASQRRYCEEAQSHVVAFFNFSHTKINQVLYLLFHIPHRLTQVKNAIYHLAKTKAVSVIVEYQKMYKYVSPDLALQIAEQTYPSLYSSLDFERRQFLFRMSLHSAETVFFLYKTGME